MKAGRDEEIDDVVFLQSPAYWYRMDRPSRMISDGMASAAGARLWHRAAGDDAIGDEFVIDRARQVELQLVDRSDLFRNDQAETLRNRLDRPPCTISDTSTMMKVMLKKA